VRYEPADRLSFAALSHLIPRRRWAKVFAMTPTTLLAWHRKLVAKKWDYSRHRQPGRPPTAAAVTSLVLRMATENPNGEHRRIHGELTRLGHTIAASTIWNILHHPGIDPAPQRTGPTWKQFLTAQAEHIVAVDFLHVDTVNLKRLYALVMLEHSSRRTHLPGVTANPTGQWTTQAARNLPMSDKTGIGTKDIKFLIRDRGGQFTDTSTGTEGQRPPRTTQRHPTPRAPRPNPHHQRTAPAVR
jgi:putative transposase